MMTIVETQLSEVSVDPMTNEARSSWLSFIMKDVKEAKNSQPQAPKIPRVPNELLRNENKECYHPLAVSIGPYHYSDRSGKLREVEDLKIAMTRQFVLDSGKPIERLYSKIEQVAENARGFYGEGLMDGFNEVQFAQMMFLDGCFILQFIHCVTGHSGDLEMSDQQVAHVKRDLLLLENQLPFLVLESLIRERYEEVEKDHGMKSIYDFLFFQIHQPGHQPLPIWARILIVPWLLLLLYSCAIPFFNLRYYGHARDYGHADVHYGEGHDYGHAEYALIGTVPLGAVILFGMILWLVPKFLSVRRKKKMEALRYGGQLLKDQGPVHLLELLYFTLLGSQKGKTKPSDASIGSRGHYLYYSAKDLKKVGIRFSPSKEGTALSDVTLKSSIFYGTLNLPPITIDESTEAMLLNLVAYETSAAHAQLWVTSYICFLDSLIEDAEDVKELRSKGILFNYLGPDKQVADLINHMGSCLESENISVYNDVKRDINKQSERIMNKWVAEWQHTYFNSPWAFTAFVAAGVGLALTATQVYYTIHPPERNTEKAFPNCSNASTSH